ncbi:Fur family transcriptional regulator [Pelagibacterium xiamenense]|uniref:Fur family transcriptional regulator n=1 Tax=Pelagibacterium xiamenense TaxID=2901140 RepID=UPI001E2B8733|nr:Fur family transcriptional regulator [Pelagibacterium xiamenense]MCD7059696.1 transcriptional repressor [Pelagibacterium xiamenense]
MNHRARLTPNQELIWNALLAAGTPLGAYALLERVKGGTMKAPLQVYRALDKLVALGLVHRLESLNAFVACAHHHKEDGPAAFAICESCGQVEEFTEAGVGRGLAQWSKRNDFQPRKITVELRGLCGECQEGST